MDEREREQRSILDVAGKALVGEFRLADWVVSTPKGNEIMPAEVVLHLAYGPGNERYAALSLGYDDLGRVGGPGRLPERVRAVLADVGLAWAGGDFGALTRVSELPDWPPRPERLVQWLATNRPGQGARTDLNRRTGE